jgi:hypothetical protein
MESFGDIIESCDYFLFLSLPVGYSFGGGLASKVAMVLLFILYDVTCSNRIERA